MRKLNGSLASLGHCQLLFFAYFCHRGRWHGKQRVLTVHAPSFAVLHHVLIDVQRGQFITLVGVPKV